MRLNALLGLALAGLFFCLPTLAADATWTVAGQLTTQFIGIGATIVFAGVLTLILCVVVEKTIGFRLDETREKEGLDHALHGEQGYGLLNLN